MASTPKKKTAGPAKASSPQDFKKKRGNGLVELPSGLVIKLKNPGGLGVFLKKGIIPNSLMGVVHDSLEGKKTNADEVAKSIGVDETAIEEMVELLDNILITCAVEPKVFPVPEDENDRDDDLLYADEIEETDKMFVFQWMTGGTSDLESFRERYSKGLADMG